VCSISLIIGGRLLRKAVIDEAHDRVRLDLNAAREIYLSRINRIHIALNVISMTSFLDSPQKHPGPMRLDATIRKQLDKIARKAGLDFMGIVDVDGKTLHHLGVEDISQDNAGINPIAALALKKRDQIAGTVVLSKKELLSESPLLADQARIHLSAREIDAPDNEVEEASGMALAAAVPIVQNGNVIAALYGGILLNKSEDIVDKVRDTVLQGGQYKGSNIGAATIFLKDIRISTNALDVNEKRAIGTRAPKEIAQAVFKEGNRWTGRAFVVKDWHIASYEPIEDIFGKRVGMLYVGALEAKYADMRSEALRLFIAITVAGMGLAIGLGFILADRISRPVQGLIKAGAQVSKGNLSPEIGPISNSEIGELQKTFKEMLRSLRERDEMLKAESENRLLQYEKLAGIGKLAGGVAHEINNPLTGIFTFTHMLLNNKNLPEDARADLEVIAEEMERVRKIVKGLLDFSRQTQLESELTDINALVSGTISLIENQALIKGIGMKCVKAENLPEIALDKNKISSVLLKLMINALDATDHGGQITIETGVGFSADNPDRKGIEIIVRDTGCGIAPENMHKIFDPFFTTKEVGKGTGLGLSISYGIIERHGGTIRAQSEIGRGSEFIVWLPIEEQTRTNANISS
jgi:two-component system NtrC family sensor kinase